MTATPDGYDRLTRRRGSFKAFARGPAASPGAAVQAGTWAAHARWTPRSTSWYVDIG